MWRTIYCISWCGVYVVLQTYIAFSAMTHILYFLILHTYCISWCGVQHTVFPAVAYTFCISWCDVMLCILYRLMRCKYCSSDIRNTSRYGVYPVFPDVTYFLYSLMCHTIKSISWYGVHPIFTDVTYFLYFLMWRLYCSSQMHSISFLHFLMWRPLCCISWCGVYIIFHRYIAFPDMAYILYFLMWHTFCISWCGVQYFGSTDMTDVLLFRHT